MRFKLLFQILFFTVGILSGACFSWGSVQAWSKQLPEACEAPEWLIPRCIDKFLADGRLKPENEQWIQALIKELGYTRSVKIRAMSEYAKTIWDMIMRVLVLAS